MPGLSKVLIANRGEIAVRIARACADASIASVAVYADGDRDAKHVKMADEAYSLGGVSAAQTYLDADKLIAAAHRSCADAVHPGYGFLSESAEFAQAVIDAGLTWIGPSPAALRALGDKVSARQIAARVGVPLVAGTNAPVSDVQEILDFVDMHGLPIIIKAAFGGGGRGLKVVNDRSRIPELFELAVREATASFGRGECFVEKYLSRPRHIETQCLADAHGTVAVVSTRDCSLQRRHQKLVEEAPAPHITAEQQDELVHASGLILRDVGYVGAATCEFLLGAEGISFLEVNTRLQVEHPVSEEVSGIDLVREQFRLAAGEEVGYQTVASRGHAIEFRINAEDPAHDFLPSPGAIKVLRLPSGPGVRLDFGYEAGDVLPGAFDSMLGKIVIWGADRGQALARARRALRELKVVGVPTVLPFHQAVLDEPDFIAADGHLRVHTAWIDTEFVTKLEGLGTQDAPDDTASDSPTAQSGPHLIVEVDGKRFEVVIPSSQVNSLRQPHSAAATPHPRHPAVSGTTTKKQATVTAPMPGVIVKVAAEQGSLVAEGDLLVIVEAMKMQQPTYAPKGGTVVSMNVAVGDHVQHGQTICTIA